MDIATIVSIFAFILALNFGSFTNVLIYRVPKHNFSINHPRRSICPHCKTTLKWWENIPLLSYVFLGGKCRYCPEAISIRYPVVELVFGLISLPFIYKLVYQPLLEFTSLLSLDEEFTQFHLSDIALLANYYGLELMLIFIFLSIAIALAFIDHARHELPHELTYSGILIGLINAFLFGDILHAAASIGAIFFIIDALTHFMNKLYYKEQALSISPGSITFRTKTLTKNINLVYLSLILVSAFLYFQDMKLALEIIFLILGVSYIVNDLFIDFFLAPKAKQIELDEQTLEEEKFTVMGGGDAAMMAFIASLFYIQDTLLIILFSFYLAVVYFIFLRIYQFFVHIFKKESENLSKDKRVPLGGALAVSLIAAMILTVLNGFK